MLGFDLVDEDDQGVRVFEMLSGEKREVGGRPQFLGRLGNHVGNRLLKGTTDEPTTQVLGSQAFNQW